MQILFHTPTVSHVLVRRNIDKNVCVLMHICSNFASDDDESIYSLKYLSNISIRNSANARRCLLAALRQALLATEISHRNLES